MPAHGPDFKGEKMKKKVAKKGTPRAKKPSGRRSAPSAETVWMPVDSMGRLWVRWANNNRRKLVIELNDGFVGWRGSGVKIVRAEVKPKSPKGRGK